MSNKALFYQTDFKPDYQVFQQKVSQLSKEKNRITKTQIDIEKLKHQLELINQQIDDQLLSYDNSSIFTRYATIQQLSQKKKSPSDLCLHCGQEMKKPIQCQFCAQLYCKNCCWRKRVIPFQQHTDFRLCCEQCHEKYIKHFNNQQFYKEKAIYLAAIDELERKYDKTRIKYEKKENQVKEYKQQKRAIKIKQGNLKKALLEQQKTIKLFTEEYQRAIQNKALEIRQQQQKQRNKNKQLQQEKQKFQQQKLKQQQKRTRQLEQEKQRILQNSRKRQEQLAKRQAEILKQKEQLERQKMELKNSKIQKFSKSQENIQEKPKVIEENINQILTTQFKAEIQTQNVQDNKSKEQKQQKLNQIKIKQEQPRKVVFNQQLDFDAILKEDDIKPMNQPQQQKVIEENKQPKKDQQKSQVTLKQLLKQIKENKKVQDTQNVSRQNKHQEEGKQEKSQKSKNSQSQSKQKSQEVNEPERLTMTKIKTMNINDLLSMKIPMNPSASPSQKKPRKSSHPQIKVDGQQNSTTTQNQKMYQSLLEPQYLPLPQSTMVGLALPGQNQQQAIGIQQILRQSIKSVHEEEQNQDDKQNSKLALLMRQSLISSSNKVSIVAQKQPEYNEQETVMGQPQKCTCEIM